MTKKLFEIGDLIIYYDIPGIIKEVDNDLGLIKVSYINLDIAKHIYYTTSVRVTNSLNYQEKCIWFYHDELIKDINLNQCIHQKVKYV